MDGNALRWDPQSGYTRPRVPAFNAGRVPIPWQGGGPIIPIMSPVYPRVDTLPLEGALPRRRGHRRAELATAGPRPFQSPCPLVTAEVDLNLERRRSFGATSGWCGSNKGCCRTWTPGNGTGGRGGGKRGTGCGGSWCLGVLGWLRWRRGAAQRTSGLVNGLADAR